MSAEQIILSADDIRALGGRFADEQTASLARAPKVKR